jgi:hypothetical protein
MQSEWTTVSGKHTIRYSVASTAASPTAAMTDLKIFNTAFKVYILGIGLQKSTGSAKSKLSKGDSGSVLGLNKCALKNQPGA